MNELELSNIAKSEDLREMKGSLFEFAVSALTKDPAGAIMSLAEAINSVGSLRDAIFYESFVRFL